MQIKTWNKRKLFALQSIFMTIHMYFFFVNFNYYDYYGHAPPTKKLIQNWEIECDFFFYID